MLKKILHNTDRKRLVENFFSLSAIHIFALLLPLLTLPYILRVIGLEKYGTITLAWSLIYYFTSITDYSFKITATRDIAIFKTDKKKVNIIYSKVMIIQTLLQLFSYSIIIAIIYLYRPFYEERLIFWLTMPFLLGNTIFPDWFFQGIEKMKYITFINISIKVIFTLLVFLLIKAQRDYWIYPTLQTMGSVAAGIVGQAVMIKKYGIRFYWIKPKSILQTFKRNFPIFTNQFLPNLYNNSSVFLLGVLTTPTLVGIFDAIRKVINLCSTAIDLISRVFFPFINRKKEAFYKYKKFMLIIGITLTVIPVLFYKLILMYLNINYDLAFWIILILSLGVFFLSLYDIFGINYFIVHRQDKIVMTNTIYASFIGFALAIVLIAKWNIIGAALSVTVARMIMGLGLTYKYYRIEKTI